MKPSWNDAPHWANWLAKNTCGVWHWYHTRPIFHTDSGNWASQNVNTLPAGVDDRASVVEASGSLEARVQKAEPVVMKHIWEPITVGSTAVKFDQNKPRLGLIPPQAIWQVGAAMTYGANKYSPWNYLKGRGLEPDRLLDAAFRHLAQHVSGERKDSESGEDHLAHAAASILMAMEVIAKREGKTTHPTEDGES